MVARMSASRLFRALALAGALVTVAGCEHTEDTDVEFIYEMADYEIAEAAVTGQVRNRLDQQNMELRGLWLGLRPVDDGPAMLNADADVFARSEQAEEISRLVAETCLDALPKHETVRVRVYWWSDAPGHNYPHHAGTWTWNADGEMIDHTQPAPTA
ncbi:MAG: hypothetical protein R6V07_18715 [Armatimonadota bacterium]